MGTKTCSWAKTAIATSSRASLRTSTSSALRRRHPESGAPSATTARALREPANFSSPSSCCPAGPNAQHNQRRDHMSAPYEPTSHEAFSHDSIDSLAYDWERVASPNIAPKRPFQVFFPETTAEVVEAVKSLAARG